MARRFTDQQPFTVTEADLKAHWAGGKPGQFFRCYLCGYRFQLGDRCRWQYTNDIKGASGNPLVCAECDTSPEAVIAEWVRMHAIYASDKFWWFRRIH
jgi:hypothetical protein